MADGAPAVRAALERRGVEVHTYDGSEVSLKGDGGPTCLTAPLLRAAEDVGKNPGRGGVLSGMRTPTVTEITPKPAAVEPDPFLAPAKPASASSATAR